MQMIELPYIGAFSFDGDGAVVAGGAPTGTGALIGAGVGSVVPGVGTGVGAAVGALMEQVGGVFKGKTKKVEYDTADQQALKISHELAKQVQTQKSASEFDRFAPGYISFVEQYLRASDWWSKAEAVRIADELKNDVHKLYSKSSYDKVQACVWLLSMWILTQSPADRYDWIKGYLETHFDAAYIKYWFPGAVAPSTGTTTPSAKVPSAATVQEEQKAIITYVLIAGGVILILMTAVALFRK